ncbi:MAG: hypothetical protein HW414_1563, partial [Dehalococcoidia bacterium]|nr:hypothetical protein [Dehalococcoidia bacterium]
MTKEVDNCGIRTEEDKKYGVSGTIEEKMRRLWYSFAVLLLVSGVVLSACAAPKAPAAALSPV